MNFQKQSVFVKGIETIEIFNMTKVALPYFK